MNYRLKSGSSTITAIFMLDGKQREITTGIKVPPHIKFTPPSSFTGGTHQEIMDLTRKIVNFDLGVFSQSSQNTLSIWATEYVRMVEAGEIRTKTGSRIAHKTILSLKSRVNTILQMIKVCGDLDFYAYGHHGENMMGKKTVSDKYSSYSAAFHDYMARYSTGTQINVASLIDSIVRKMSQINDISVKDEYLKLLTSSARRIANEPTTLESDQIDFIIHGRQRMKAACKGQKQKDLVDWMIIGLVTGARYSDICSWTTDNIIDVKGQFYLNYTPSKTMNSSRVVVRVPLPPIALQIFNMSHPTGKLMPYRSNSVARSSRELLSKFPIFDRDVVIVKNGQPMTKKMHQVFKFHWLRSSSASYMVSKGVPQDIVRSILGHSMSSKSFDLYATILDKERTKAVNTVWRD